MDQIYPLYPGEWVLVRLIGANGERGETHGQVLAHGRSRKRISDAVLRAHRADPAVRTYVFYGGRRGSSADEWRELLAEAARLGPLNVGW